MEFVFNTDDIEPARRFTAWRETICDCYVQVDVEATRPEDYRGYVRAGRFGNVALTDIFVSEQHIERNARHLARLDKDCYYFQILHQGAMSVLQKGTEILTNAARGGLFCATEQYELHCIGDVRSFYLEIPRQEFAERFPSDRVPLTNAISSTQGLGRITSQFCASLAAEGARLPEAVRVDMGRQLMDLLALTVLAGEDTLPEAESSVRRARLRSVQIWIEQHLADHDLTLERIARANNMSLRYLHLLFEQCDVSASEWIWSRRLQVCYDEIARGDGRSITSIAFANGFNNSAHFSVAFRKRFNMSPRELARTTSLETKGSGQKRRPGRSLDS